MMKLFYSAASPYVRKVMVVAHETGQAEGIEKVATTLTPVKRDPAVASANPLSKLPTAVTDDGIALYDSRVICEYLDAQAGGKLFGQGAARWRALARQAAADGLLDAALLSRYEELLRPEASRSAEWLGGQAAKINAALDQFEKDADALSGSVDIGGIAVGCALGWLDFRFSGWGWRDKRPKLAAWFKQFEERPSMQATRPSA